MRLFETAFSNAKQSFVSEAKVRRHLDSANNVLGRDQIWFSAVFATFILQALLVIIHEPWADEWQALQIALLSPDFSALLENLRYEGHPPLWYLILRYAGFFAHPLYVLMFVQLCIMLATQALVLFCLPTSRAHRLCFALSYFLLIEYGTVARSHSLGALLLIAFFVAKNPFVRWGIIALLPMVDFQFGLLSIAAIVILWRAGYRSAVGLLVWFVSSLLSAWTVMPAPDMTQAQTPYSGLSGVLPTVSLLSSQLIPLHVFPGRIDWGLPWPGVLGLVMGIFFIWMADIILRYDNAHRLVFHGFTWSCVAFASFVYPFGVRHFTLVPLLLVLLVATHSKNRRFPPLLFNIWMTTVAAAGIFGAGISFVLPFDVSDKAAEKIRAQGLENELWVAWPDFTGAGLVSRLQKEMVSLKKGCTQAFNRWDTDHRFDSAEDMSKALGSFADQYGSFYISSAMNLDAVAAYIPMRHVAMVPAGYNHYELHLYKVAYGRKPRGGRPPSCAPTRLPISAWRSPAFRQK